MSPRPAPVFTHFDHPEGDRKVRVGACHRDAHDPSHKQYDAGQFAPDDLPGFVDLRPHLTPVEDQGDLGSCTANALAGAVEYLEKRVSNNPERVSRLFIYWNERDLEGETNKDEGAAISDGIKALKNSGVCSEEVWPYDVKTVFKKPHDDAYGDAEPHTIDEAQRVKIDVHDMRHCLAEGYPFVFGLQIFKPFEDTANDGVVAVPEEGESDSCGGHAMLCVGYSDEDEVFVVRNSWGPKWGDKGYCYIPYDYLTNAKMAHDAWTLRRAHDLDFNQGAAGADLPHGAKTSFFGDTTDTSDTNSDDDSSDTDDTNADTNDSDDSDDSGDASDSDDAAGDGDDGSVTSSEIEVPADGDGDAAEEKIEEEIKELEGEIAELEDELKKS